MHGNCQLTVGWNFDTLKQSSSTLVHLYHRAYKKSTIKAFLTEKIQLTKLEESTSELHYSVSEERSPSYTPNSESMVELRLSTGMIFAPTHEKIPVTSTVLKYIYIYMTVNMINFVIYVRATLFVYLQVTGLLQNWRCFNQYWQLTFNAFNRRGMYLVVQDYK